ncbi:MAG: 2-oxo acid dehydrogenase subunit E2 [Planctomycetaceae bacterium]|nr:2-oxo acid dehydrogenase subunit E2 [Planctomycetaceae bacterium]
MADVIIMPKLGYNMDEGRLVAWHCTVGDAIRKGEVFFEIETDETVMPVEATADGVVLKLVLEEGAYAAVFTPIAVVGQPGEDADVALAAASGGESESQSGPAPEPSIAAAPALTGRRSALKLTPKAKRLVREENLDPASLAGITGTGFRGGITAKDIMASPLARKLAERNGVDLTEVHGSGAGGKVMRADVERYAATPTAGGEKRIRSSVPYKGVRKIIGDRLAESKFTAPHLYFTDVVDATNFAACRASLNSAGDVRIAVSDLLTLAAARALVAFPDVNVSLVDGNIVSYASVNIGNAVAGDNGLVVPVIKNVQDKSLTAIARENRDLVERAKTGRVQSEEYSGGTFTISNLGMFGIENFTAIINPPESAILSVSSVRKKPVVVTGDDGEDTLAIRPMMTIQLSVDHRLIDGLLAARFVAYFKALLENPLRMLL